MKKVKALIIAAVMLVCANSANAQSNVKNLNYDRGYRFDIELACSIPTIWEFSSSHGYSFGNGLYVGGGAGYWSRHLKIFNQLRIRYAPRRLETQQRNRKPLFQNRRGNYYLIRYVVEKFQ